MHCITLQGRYIASRSENIDFRELAAALKQEFPDLPIQDAPAHPVAGKLILDDNKVGTFINLQSELT